MNKKKFLALAFALVLALGLLSGCGGGEKPSGSGASGGGSQSSSGGEPAAAKVELTVVTSYGGDDGNRKNYEKTLTAEWNKPKPTKTAENKTTVKQPFPFFSTEESFEHFFGFCPLDNKTDSGKNRKTSNTKTNPLDTTEMFERYMGIRNPKRAGGRK